MHFGASWNQIWPRQVTPLIKIKLKKFIRNFVLLLWITNLSTPTITLHSTPTINFCEFQLLTFKTMNHHEKETSTTHHLPIIDSDDSSTLLSERLSELELTTTATTTTIEPVDTLPSTTTTPSSNHHHPSAFVQSSSSLSMIEKSNNFINHRCKVHEQKMMEWNQNAIQQQVFHQVVLPTSFTTTTTSNEQTEQHVDKINDQENEEMIPPPVSQHFHHEEQSSPSSESPQLQQQHEQQLYSSTSSSSSHPSSSSNNNITTQQPFNILPMPTTTTNTSAMHYSNSSNSMVLTPRSQALMDKRRNTLSIQPYFVHKRGSQELPELIPPTNPYRKIATLSNLKASPQQQESSLGGSSGGGLVKVTSMQSSNSNTSSHPPNVTTTVNGNHVVSTSNVKLSSPTSSPTLANSSATLNLSSSNSPHQDSSYLKFRQALENDDYSLIDFGMEVNSAQTSASEITFPVPKSTSDPFQRGAAFYGSEKLGSQQGNYYFNNPQTSTAESCRKNSVIDDSLSDNGYSPPTEITRHYELYIICIGDLDHCLVNTMLKTAGGHMYTANRQVSFILKNTSEKVTFSFNFYSQFNWYLMDFLKGMFFTIFTTIVKTIGHQ